MAGPVVDTCALHVEQVTENSAVELSAHKATQRDQMDRRGRGCTDQHNTHVAVLSHFGLIVGMFVARKKQLCTAGNNSQICDGGVKRDALS